jgi:hypothetical protein
MVRILSRQRQHHRRGVAVVRGLHRREGSSVCGSIRLLRVEGLSVGGPPRRAHSGEAPRRPATVAAKFPRPVSLTMLSAYVSAAGAEAGAILRRSCFEMALKRSAHNIRAVEATGRRNFFQPAVGILELSPDGFQADLLDIEGRRFPDFPREDSLEVALAHCDASSQRWCGKITLQVFDDPNLQIAERPIIGALLAKRDTKLRLITRPAEENHQHAGNFKRDLLSVVFLDQGEAEIDSRSHTGRAIDVAVTNPDRVAVDRNFWEARDNSLTKAQWVAARLPSRSPA